MTDPISDMLTRIRNAHAALLPMVELPHSKIKERIAHILKKEGYITDCSVDGKPAKKLKLKLKYEGRKGVIEGLRRVSSPRSASLRRLDGDSPCARRDGHVDCLDLAGRDDRYRRPEKQTRRRVVVFRLVIFY